MDDTHNTNLVDVPERTVETCLFCRPKRHEIIDEHPLALTVTDVNPVVPGHCLIIPRRHAPTWFDLRPEEVQAVFELSERARRRLVEEDAAISGFNLGTNAGLSAGQSVFHCHVHLFPRREGDREDPRGGVRQMFPENASYDRSGL